MKISATWVGVVGWCLTGLIGAQGAVDEGAYVLQKEGNRYSLEANHAPVTDVLRELAAQIDVPLAIDDEDESTLTVQLTSVNIEDLIEGISEGYAIVYIVDEDTGEFVIEKIMAVGASDAVTQVLPEGRLDGEKVVKAIMDRARSVERYHQKMKMSMEMMGQKQQMDGEMWMDGDKMYMSMTTPPFNQEQIIVSDGKTTYTYMPMMKMVQTLDMEKFREAMGEDAGAMGAPAKVGEPPDPFDGVDHTTLEFVGNEMVGEEEVYVLEGGFTKEVKEMQAMNPFAPESARFWVSKADGMPRRTVFFNKDGGEMMSQEYQDVVINPEIDPSRFEFTPPEDVQVVDMTEGIINMLNAGKEAEGEMMPTP
ncbi:MAG: DUF2092 domain-containing protein [Spartobacteria bacterium]|nr:DUF2092 domain-containing protein [Spartobacteria bacterium]